MRGGGAIAALMLLAACGREGEPASRVEGGGGEALEQAALARGLVQRDRDVEPTGAYASGGDRACVMPLKAGGYRVGAALDYGDDQHCLAIGTASGRARLSVDFGGGCRIEAAVDADRLAFPATVPAGCERLCSGRASLAALSAARLSSSAAEAARMTTADDRALCPG